MFVKIIGIFAEFERENLAERVSFGYEQKTREGNYTNTQGVYGYDYIPGEQKLIVNDVERELVNRIFDLYIDGYSSLKIAKKFNRENVPTKRGGHWASTTVYSILNNPLYIGKVRYGTQEKNKDRAFVVDGKNIEPIISEEKWNNVHTISKQRKKYVVRRYPSENSYFFHIIKCARCGGEISARQQIQNGKLYISYKCNNAARDFCTQKHFSHKNVEKAFIDYLKNFEKMIPNEKIITEDNNKNKYGNELLIIENKINKLEEKKKDIRHNYINDLIDINEYKAMINELDEQIKYYINKKNDIGIPSEEEKEYSYEDIKDIITNIELNWEHLTNKEKQQFLLRFVKRIDVDKIDEHTVVIKNLEFNI